MSSLAWISVTANGKAIPIRIDDILRVRPVVGSVGGSIITFKTDVPPLEVSDTPSGIYTKIDALWDEYTTALGNP